MVSNNNGIGEKHLGIGQGSLPDAMLKILSEDLGQHESTKNKGQQSKRRFVIVQSLSHAHDSEIPWTAENILP